LDEVVIVVKIGRREKMKGVKMYPRTHNSLKVKGKKKALRINEGLRKEKEKMK